MRFFETNTMDGRVVRGLLSAADGNRSVIVHQHGFGGSCFANPFVRSFHLKLPNHGCDFLSFDGRFAGYVNENYSERSVVYCGSSVELFDHATADLEAIVNSLSATYDRIVIQGHSFGTNIVKLLAREADVKMPAIFLSPADSVVLHEEWRRAGAVDLPVADEVNRNVYWDRFGIAAGSLRYELPISPRSLTSLVNSDVFSEWSRDDAILKTRALVVIGVGDPISNVGKTGNRDALMELLPGSKIELIPGSGHIFSGFEDQLLRIVMEWIGEL